MELGGGTLSKHFGRLNWIIAEVDTIRKQCQGGQWPQFLQMVAINGLRGWTGQAVEFNFPVVAIVGENGKR